MSRTLWYALCCSALALSSLSAATAGVIRLKPPRCKRENCASQALGINSSNEVLGFVENHGYVWDQKDGFVVFSAGKGDTSPVAINDTGDVAGIYDDRNGSFAGFLRKPGGKFIRFSIPDGSQMTVTGLNVNGDVTGSFKSTDDKIKGYVRAASGQITKFSIPNNWFTATVPASINASGTVAGVYSTKKGGTYGFIRSHGTITKFDPGGRSLTVTRINDNGVVVGYFTDVNGNTHGFIRNTDGSFTQVDVPGATATGVASINGNGDVAGNYVDAGGYEHGFMRGVEGQFTLFNDHPRVFRFQQSFANDINESRAVVGGVSHFSYLRTP